MEKHLNAPEAKFLLFKDGKPLMQTTGETKTPTGLLYLSQPSITPYLPSKSFAECPEPENKDVAKQYQSARLPTSLPALVFLGIDDRTEAKEGAVPAEVDPKDPKGVPYFALDVSGANVDLRELGKEGKEEGQGHGAEFVEPRLAGSSLGGWEANLFAQARALMGESESSKVSRAQEFDLAVDFRLRLRDETFFRLHLSYQPTDTPLKPPSHSTFYFYFP